MYVSDPPIVFDVSIGLHIHGATRILRTVGGGVAMIDRFSALCIIAQCPGHAADAECQPVHNVATLDRYVMFRRTVDMLEFTRTNNRNDKQATNETLTW